MDVVDGDVRVDVTVGLTGAAEERGEFVDGAAGAVRDTGERGPGVVVIEPGGIATEWGAIAADQLEKSSTAGAYAAQGAAVATSLRSEANAKRNSPPPVVSDRAFDAVISRAVGPPR
ncbi:hypothetical protein ACIPSE_12215 [Streptomyces sp. NPDC090106]|uniref:hypothetical protein n=1 Tax=Streptomyces sp. NPDC090106 TaxID=3365946 RepID=UPI00380CEB78